MVYAKFFDILINSLFLLIALGIAVAVAKMLIAVGNIIISRRLKGELPEALTSEIITTEFATDSRSIRTKREMDELLFQMEKEKRAISLGFNNMSPTHKEFVRNRMQKIEERIQGIKKTQKFLPS